MSNSSIRRRLAAGIAGAFVAATAVVATTAGVANAANCTTAVTLKAGSKTTVYKAFNSLTADASTAAGGCSDPYVGLTTIERWNGSAWIALTPNYSGASYTSYYGEGKFAATGTYRAVYSGGSNSSHTWAPSVSASVKVYVIRKVNVADRSTRRASAAAFSIKPASSIKGKKAVFQVYKSGAWRSYKSITVPSDGSFRTTFANSRKGIKYRMVLPGGTAFAKSVHGPFVATRR